MDQHKRGFFRSFLDKRIAQYVLLDGLLVIALYFLFTTFGDYIKTKSQSMQGFDVSSMMSTAPEQAQAYLSSLKLFLAVFVIGLLLILLFTWLFYSLTQSLIWADLNNKKFSAKYYVRFSLLQIIFIIPFIMLVFIFSLLRTILNSTLSNISSSPLFSTVGQVIMLVFIVGLLLVAFAVYLCFTRLEKIWQSIGDGFSLLKKDARKVGLLLLQGWALFVVVSFLILLIQYLVPHKMTVMIISVIAYLILLAWLRVRFVEEQVHPTRERNLYK